MWDKKHLDLLPARFAGWSSYLAQQYYERDKDLHYRWSTATWLQDWIVSPGRQLLTQWAVRSVCAQQCSWAWYGMAGYESWKLLKNAWRCKEGRALTPAAGPGYRVAFTLPQGRDTFTSRAVAVWINPLGWPEMLKGKADWIGSQPVWGNEDKDEGYKKRLHLNDNSLFPKASAFWSRMCSHVWYPKLRFLSFKWPRCISFFWLFQKFVAYIYRYM